MTIHVDEDSSVSKKTSREKSSEENNSMNSKSKRVSLGRENKSPIERIERIEERTGEKRE